MGMCPDQLVEITGGRLFLGDMPPLDGGLEQIRRIEVDSQRVGPRDVFWALQGSGYNGAWYAERAFSQGALGVILSGRPLLPWAGTFAIIVEDANQAFTRFMRCLTPECLQKNLVFARSLDVATIRQIKSGDGLEVVDRVTADLARWQETTKGNTESSTTVS